MSLRNPKLFGLNVLSYLSDIVDKNQALNAINLPLTDLDIVRGASNAGMSRDDFKNLSRLTTPIYKSLGRFGNESSNYISILNKKAGTTQTLFGNLVINGGLSGNSIRYRYVDGTGPLAIVKIADISTSRVSAWSSFANPVLNTSPISYGARVGIITGGALQFGTASLPNQIRLQTITTPQPKEFNSEIPTNKISCNIGGRVVTLYAMKGIPLIFTGFFRNLDASISLTSLINDIPASWKIIETTNSNSFTNYRNQGTTTSSIAYRSNIARERNIQFYYDPNYILSIIINSANITTLPKFSLPNLSTLNLSFNGIRNFPDLNFISPNIQNLFLIQNPFFQSDIATERTLNSNVISKIPTGLKELHLGGTFSGSIPENIIGNRFTELRALNLSRGGGPSFSPDSNDPNGYTPNVPNTCESYNISSNDFRTIGPSSGSSYNVKELTNLITLSLAGNGNLTDSNFSISASNTKIQSINISGTGLPLPDLNGKQSLISFFGTSCRNIESLLTSGGNYKFAGCGALRTLDLRSSPVTGAIPKFSNSSLTYLDLGGTTISGGDPNGDTSFVIPEKTFELTSDLLVLNLQSPNLLTSPIHPTTFSYTPNITQIVYNSSGRTTGAFPNISTCSRLGFLNIRSNNFTGNIPNFASNPNIYYADLSFNSFSGSIPSYRNLSALNQLYLYNNQFTRLLKFQNLPNLVTFQAHNNRLSGTIPDFSDCPNIFNLLLFNNRFTDYAPGSFLKIYRINYLDLSGNFLTQQAINSIVDDLFINYTTINRGGVTINLRGNATPGIESIDKIQFLRSRGWTIVYS